MRTFRSPTPDNAGIVPRVIQREIELVIESKFRIRGVGAASSGSVDPQAKSLGEYLRAKVIDVPVSLTEHLNLAL